MFFTRVFWVASVLLFTGGLAGCSEKDDQHAKQAARWLKDTSGLYPLPYGWQYGTVTPLGSDGVEMDVHIANEEQEKNVRSMPQMKRFAAVQPACPKKDAEIWTFLNDTQKVWVNLIGTNGERLTRGSCWQK